jgi:hypothetical protein
MFEMQTVGPASSLVLSAFDDALFGGFGCTRRITTIEELAADAFRRSERTSPEHPDELSDFEPDTGGDSREIFSELGLLSPSTIITESGLAALLGKACRESVKRAVARGELPQPVKLMGKNVWTAGVIVKHLEERLETEARKIARMRPNG